MRYFSLDRRGVRLRGIVLRPKEASGPLPVVILSHGFSSNMLLTRRYAAPFLNTGHAVVLYDFCGSGSGVSGGKSTEMSVLTEREDLLAVLSYARTLPFADPDRITLAGCSQGGLVSALAAALRPEEVKRLILYYPALCIPDDARRGKMINARFDPEHVPETFHSLAVKLGRRYAADAASLEPFREICGYSGMVLIVHGVEDALVPIDYSRRAAALYPDCRLVEVHGDHGFVKSGMADCESAVLAFLKDRPC